jgi:hypothetical protein
LAEENWDNILNAPNVHLAVTELERTIHMHMDKCMPFRTVRMSSRDPVWMTPLIKSLMRIKSRVPSRNVDRIGEINRRILEIISKIKDHFCVFPSDQANGGKMWIISHNVDGHQLM